MQGWGVGGSTVVGCVGGVGSFTVVGCGGVGGSTVVRSIILFTMKMRKMSTR